MFHSIDIAFFAFAQSDFIVEQLYQKRINQKIAMFIKQVKSTSVSPEDSIVPVKFHMTAYSDSTGGIDSSDIFEELNIVNQFFLNAALFLNIVVTSIISTIVNMRI